MKQMNMTTTTTTTGPPPSPSSSSQQDVPIGHLLRITPPDTPRSGSSLPEADHSSVDRMERASLDSKSSSTAASVVSGEVAVGDLVDVSVSSGTAVYT